jgi:hypothetical protein
VRCIGRRQSGNERAAPSSQRGRRHGLQSISVISCRPACGSSVVSERSYQFVDSSRDRISFVMQQRVYVRGRFGRAEQITLHFRAAELSKQFALRFGLDALGRRRHVARGGDIDRGLHDGRRSVGFDDVYDEAAVDLNLAEGKT